MVLSINEFLRISTVESLIFIKTRNFGRLFIGGKTLVKMINERISKTKIIRLETPCYVQTMIHTLSLYVLYIFVIAPCIYVTFVFISNLILLLLGVASSSLIKNTSSTTTFTYHSVYIVYNISLCGQRVFWETGNPLPLQIELYL